MDDSEPQRPLLTDEEAESLIQQTVRPGQSYQVESRTIRSDSPVWRAPSSLRFVGCDFITAEIFHVPGFSAPELPTGEVLHRLFDQCALHAFKLQYRAMDAPTGFSFRECSGVVSVSSQFCRRFEVSRGDLDATIHTSRLVDAAIHCLLEPDSTACFKDCKFIRAKFEGCHYRLMRFDNCKGLWGPSRPMFKNRTAMEHAHFQSPFPYLPWETLSKIGSTRMMTLSWFTVIALVLLASLSQWWNTHVQVLSSDSLSLPSMYLSIEYFWMLLGLVCIAIALSIFWSRCPDVVANSSRHEWTVLQEREDIVYQGASWDRPMSRLFCAAFYGFGLLAAIPFGMRVVNALIYLFVTGS
ncbi:MAG: hypothetical protein H6814_08990 [Phycisphaeraceae bacterium]|nr:hypothetical protein [Phycisphaeraceae bacterium]